MCTELEYLSQEYLKEIINNPNINIFEKVETLEYDNLHKEGLILNVKHIYADDNYRIYYFVSKDNKIILNKQIKCSKENLNNEYKKILDDMKSISIKEFIIKYCY